MKSVLIWSFFWSVFYRFGLNTEIVDQKNLRISTFFMQCIIPQKILQNVLSLSKCYRFSNKGPHFSIFQTMQSRMKKLSRLFSSTTYLTFSRRESLSYRNQSIDLIYKSMDWFLYNRNLRLKRCFPMKHLWRIILAKLAIR